ncbi:MAG: hypothetical protein GX285_08850 [Clostridiales bacterium]|nr:hypothetical protein [Clostridiales bacterium]
MSTNTNSPEKAKVKVSKKFTAVDLASIAAFSVLVRVLWYLVKMVDIAFPFNMSLLVLIYALGASAVVVVVHKQWTLLLYTIGWMLINFFLQGELVLFWIYVNGYWILPELFFYARIKAGVDPQKLFMDTKSVVLGGFLYGFCGLITLDVAYHYLYMLPIPMNLMIITAGISVITGLVGASLGNVNAGLFLTESPVEN